MKKIFMRAGMNPLEKSVVNNFDTDAQKNKNFEYKVQLITLKCEGQFIDLQFKITGTNDTSVQNPRVSIIFWNGSEDRRLPLSINKYTAGNTENPFVLEVSHRYRADLIFSKNADYRNIYIIPELSYAQDKVELPLIPPNETEQNHENDCLYQYEFFDKKQCIHINFPNTQKFRNAKETSLRYTRGLWSLVLTIVALLLLPLFVVESILSKLKFAVVPFKNIGVGYKYLIKHVQWRFELIANYKPGRRSLKFWLYNFIYAVSCLMPISQNKVALITSRHSWLEGNLKFVHDELIKNKNIKLKVIFATKLIREMSLKEIACITFTYASSRVSVIDDYTPLLSILNKRKKVFLIQLWHACGAFKTFGYSRLGFAGALVQESPSHRNCSYAIVSSHKLSGIYAEAFGVSQNRIKVTGVPRTDIFFDKEYREKVRRDFYIKYPNAKNKRIVLFAPTFRGRGKADAHYPQSVYNQGEILKTLGKDSFLIIKNHPFVKKPVNLSTVFKDRVLDLTGKEDINDLLFVTDLLITDYSSVVFEAALLNIPMLFYAFDIAEYIDGRGFYFDYANFVPGKIVTSFNKLLEALRQSDFEKEKINGFKERFFDHFDGKSSQRTANIIQNLLSNIKGAHL